MSDTLQEGEWCDDCHGYTHMPYCPSYEAVKDVVKGDFQESRQAKYPARVLAELTAAGEINNEQYQRLRRETVETTSEHQPAARGGGERVIIDSDLVVQPLPNTTKFLLVVEDNDWPIAEFYRAEEAEGLAYEHNQHQVLVAERERLREALTEIAAFDDTGANEILQRTGSYSGFDEPGAVQTAREALADQKGPSE